MIKLWEFLRDKEYHKAEKLIFIDFIHADELFEFIGKEWIENGLDCTISCGCLIFNVEELIDVIDMEWTEDIVKMLNEINE